MNKLSGPLHRDHWFIHSLFGEPAYSDGALCVVGRPPSKHATVELTDSSVSRLEGAMPRRSAPMAVKTKNAVHVYFDGVDLPVDTRYYEHVLAEYPRATFHKPKRGDATKPITIRSGGKIVGALMCMNIR